MKISTILLGSLIVGSTNAFNLSAWRNPNYTGTQFSTSNRGVFRLGFTARSYKWNSPLGDGCCIKFCNGNRETGSYCRSRSNPDVASGNRFNKVVIGCGSTVLNC